MLFSFELIGISTSLDVNYGAALRSRSGFANFVAARLLCFDCCVKRHTDLPLVFSRLGLIDFFLCLINSPLDPPLYKCKM